jgi:hypothetical protein
LDGGGPKTLEEIGKKFGVTRERIQQLQSIALAKLRRALAKKEKPIVRDPIQFLKPVSPDPTRTSVANATTSPKATLNLASSTRFLEIIPCVPTEWVGSCEGTMHPHKVLQVNKHGACRPREPAKSYPPKPLALTG